MQEISMHIKHTIIEIPLFFLSPRGPQTWNPSILPVSETLGIP